MSDVPDPSWLPSPHHARVGALAYATEMLRRTCDDVLPGYGAGACLPASAVIGHFALHSGIPARLVCGTFDGAPHWWVWSDGHIFDATGGQFDIELAAVSADDARGYEAGTDYPCGHETVELLYAEARRAFADPAQAEDFIDLALSVVAPAKMAVANA